MQLTTLLAATAAVVGTASAGTGFQRFTDISRRYGNPEARLHRERQQLAKRSCNTTDFRYLTENTEEYVVDYLPDVHFELGELYSGQMTVEGNSSLFFFFQPKLGDPVDEITIWMNGGPGCSSLEGFFQENGRWTWQSGTYLPVENQYSWVNLTNMLWVEQPFGTGFAQGPVTATTQEEIAQDFLKFFKNFQQTFGIKNYKIYVTGESYAGRYVPYISAAMLDEKDKTHFDVAGALIYDPTLGNDYFQQQGAAVPFVNQNYNMFMFNQSFMKEINSLHETCGYKAAIDKYLTFPALEVQPMLDLGNWTELGDCDIFTRINEAALGINPCFNIYEIVQQCPLLWDALSFTTELDYITDGTQTYFNRTDVKKAIHAPLEVNWQVCSDNDVLANDTSPMSIEFVIPQVIEATNRFLISSGDLDMILITNGTLTSIQNMTWGGKLGFQEKPSTPIEIELIDLQYQAIFADNEGEGIDGPQGVMGIQHFERGLMWAETYLSGHMQPEFQPRVTYRHLEWVLGRTEKL